MQNRVKRSVLKKLDDEIVGGFLEMQVSVSIVRKRSSLYNATELSGRGLFFLPFQKEEKTTPDKPCGIAETSFVSKSQYFEDYQF